MAYYLDLAECDYFGVEHASQLCAVGWLSHGKQFRMGSVAKGCFDKLKNLLKDCSNMESSLSFTSYQVLATIPYMNINNSWMI